MDTTISSTAVAARAREDKATARKEVKRDLERMSAAMVEEKGLLNHAQAALLLDVSTKRVGELVRLGKLSRFDFAGRTYVSMREIWDRNRLRAAAGGERRPKVKRWAAQVKAALNTDSNQVALGGYAGPYHKKRQRDAKDSERENSRARWRKIREAIRG